MTFLGWKLIDMMQADQLISLGAFAGAVAAGLYGYFRENVKENGNGKGIAKT